MSDLTFSGVVPDWLSPESLGVPFVKAAWYFGRDELFRRSEIINRNLPSDTRITHSPAYFADLESLLPRWGQEPMLIYMLGRLQRGECRALGDPDRAGAMPEWIPSRLWLDLEPDPMNDRRFAGGGTTFWNVRVVDPDAVIRIARALQSRETGGKEEGASSEKRGRRRRAEFMPFVREVVRIANKPDGLPDLPARPGEPDPLFQRLQDWAERQSFELADSTLRDWLRDVDYRRPRE
jgi:hypothetical protein